MFESKNIFDLITLLGAFQGVIFTVYLWVKPFKNRKASLFLSFFILGFALNSIYGATEGLGIKKPFSLLSFSPLYCTLFIIASFHFFIHFLTRPDDKFKGQKWLWYLPFGFQFLLQMIGFIYCLVNREKLVENYEVFFFFYDIIDVLTMVLGIAVIALSVIRIRKFNKNLKNNYAEISEFSLRWINTLLFALFGVWILFAIPNLIELITGYAPNDFYYPMWMATSFIIYWIGYSAFARRNREKPENFISSKSPSTELSQKTDIYYQELLKLMEAEKPYLNQDLNLKFLASRLDISSGYLSQIINKNEKKNFFEFINSYRVKTVKEMISEGKLEHLTLLGIAYEAGFKSKSTFNLVFKKIEGMTPSAYRKSIQS